MPKPLEIDLLYGNLKNVVFNVPSTEEEFVAAVGESSVDNAVKNVIYRNTAPRFYSDLAEAVESAGWGVRNLKAATKEKKSAEGVVSTVDVPEADMPFLDRVWNGADESRKKELEEKARTMAATYAVFEKGDRSGSGKIAQGAIESATKFINAGNEGKVAEFIEGKIPGYKVSRNSDGTISVDSLARGIAALDKYAKEQAAREQASALSQLAA